MDKIITQYEGRLRRPALTAVLFKGTECDPDALRDRHDRWDRGESLPPSVTHIGRMTGPREGSACDASGSQQPRESSPN